MVHVTLILGRMYFVIPTAYLRVCFCVCVCVCVACVACIDSLWVVYEAQMIDVWAPLERLPHRLIQTQKELSLSAFWSHCVFIKICGCVCGGKGVCVCMCKCLRVCRSCHLFPVLCASSVFGRAFDLVDRRFLQCEIAPARFTQWKSRP